MKHKDDKSDGLGSRGQQKKAVAGRKTLRPEEVDPKNLADEEDITVRENPAAAKVGCSKDEETTALHKVPIHKKEPPPLPKSLPAKENPAVAATSILSLVSGIRFKAVGLAWVQAGIRLKSYLTARGVIFFVAAVVVIASGLYFGQRSPVVQMPGQPVASSVRQKFPLKPPVAQNHVENKRPNTFKLMPLKLSPLIFFSSDNQLISPKAIKRGRQVNARFFIEAWNGKPSDPLGLTGDVRLYSTQGELILFQPKYFQFLKRIDKGKQEIKVDTQLQIESDAPPGFYRLMIDVTESATGRQATLQTRIRVVE